MTKASGGQMVLIFGGKACLSSGDMGFAVVLVIMGDSVMPMALWLHVCRHGLDVVFTAVTRNFCTCIILSVAKRNSFTICAYYASYAMQDIGQCQHCVQLIFMKGRANTCFESCSAERPFRLQIAGQAPL